MLRMMFYSFWFSRCRLTTLLVSEVYHHRRGGYHNIYVDAVRHVEPAGSVRECVCDECTSYGPTTMILVVKTDDSVFADRLYRLQPLSVEIRLNVAGGKAGNGDDDGPIMFDTYKYTFLHPYISADVLRRIRINLSLRDCYIYVTNVYNLLNGCENTLLVKLHVVKKRPEFTEDGCNVRHGEEIACFTSVVRDETGCTPHHIRTSHIIHNH